MGISSSFDSAAAANTISIVFLDCTNIILYFLSASYSEASVKFTPKRKEKDSGNLFNSSKTGFPSEYRRRPQVIICSLGCMESCSISFSVGSSRAIFKVLAPADV